MLVSAKNKKVNDCFSLTRLRELIINNKFDVTIIEKQSDVRKYISKIIPDYAIVGLGTSLTLGKLNILETLREKDNMVYGCWDGSVTNNRSLDTFEEHVIPTYYITLTETITPGGYPADADYSTYAASKGIFAAKNIFLIPFRTAVIEKDEWYKTYNRVVFRSVPEGHEILVILIAE